MKPSFTTGWILCVLLAAPVVRAQTCVGQALASLDKARGEIVAGNAATGRQWIDQAALECPTSERVLRKIADLYDVLDEPETARSYRERADAQKRGPALKLQNAPTAAASPATSGNAGCDTLLRGKKAWVREKYAILHKAMGLGMAAARTGAPANAVAKAINGTFIEYGYLEYCRPPFMRVRGHGLGCGSSAPGSLEDDNKTKLEEGMTFIIHPNQYVPETGYLTLGDTVVMGKTQAESLMQSSWDIHIKE